MFFLQEVPIKLLLTQWPGGCTMLLSFLPPYRLLQKSQKFERHQDRQQFNNLFLSGDMSISKMMVGSFQGGKAVVSKPPPVKKNRNH